MTTKTRRLHHQLPGIAGAAAGVALVLAVVYAGDLLYSRLSDDEAQLAVLARQSRAQTITPAPALPPAPRIAAWAPGTWERAAQHYIEDQIAQTISSANPPPHRAKHP